jgi:Carboxypeptidase regulatory-like domain/TonB dependent receptor/TonB-dependent Receptor Plug Domain
VTPFRRYIARVLAVLHLSLATGLKAVTSIQWQVARKGLLNRITHSGIMRTAKCGPLVTRHWSLATVLLLALVTSLSPLATAQANDARITGIVTDPSKAIIRGAKVDLINVDTGVRYPAITNGSGIYTVSGQVGTYRIEVEHIGFKTVIAPGIVLHTQDVLEINFEMAVGSASESVTVNAGATNDNPAVSMTVSREFVENMPLNGRSFQDLIQLAPGTVDATTGGQGSGYFAVDGQRTDANNYTVDGVSANLGGIVNQGQLGSAGAVLGGAIPAQTALGTTQSLASVDSLQEFTVQSSGYTAEYGRNPGGQVSFTTRSGTNQVHGTLFEYLRNTTFDANSYSNDYYGDPKTAEHQNDFGGTLGGPFIIPRVYSGRERTFFFFSYEGLRLLLPSSETEYVPTQAFRQWASPNVQPYLNASPLPSPNSPGNQDGCTVPDPATGRPTACDALFNYGYSYPSNLDGVSGRIDQSFGKHIHAFGRYTDTPSFKRTGAEKTLTAAVNVHSWTGGLTAIISKNLIDDFRFNYTRDGEESVRNMRSIGGSVPLPRDLGIPAAYDTPYAEGYSTVRVPSTSLFISNTSYSGTGTVQHQHQIVDTLNWTRSAHSLKFGGDWRHLTPQWTSNPYGSNTQITNLGDIQNGYATTLSISAQSVGKPVFDNLSLFAQDHWRLSPKLGLDYGLRWEFNPPPGPSNGSYPVTLTSSELSTATLAPTGTQPYKTNYHSFAPRVGFAWNAVPSSKHPLTVRGGFGIFFDTAQQAIGSAYASAWPFTAGSPIQTHLLLPLSDSDLAPPSLNFSLMPPYPQLNGVSSPDLTAPYTEQWNLSLDEALNSKNTVTVSYVGNNGRKLLFTQYYNNVPENPNFTELYLTSNAAQSSYNALQVQDRGRIAAGLDVVASFTWAHALDNTSNDLSEYAPIYGNSDFDLRRALNLALNYQTPTSGSSRWMRVLTQGWMIANRFSAQSGYPLNIVENTLTLPNGESVQYSPDLNPGVPVYLHNVSGVPGGWKLNRAAFACTTTGATNGPCTGSPTREGTLGRNYVRSPEFWNLNTTLQRSFPVHDELHLIYRVDAFNIFNHPNLTIIDTGLSDSTFGQSNGYSGTIGSSNALYAMGAARSLQFSLKLQF